MRTYRLAGACAALVGLTACAAPAAPPELRVLVRLAQPAGDAGSIARLVSGHAGVAARYVAPASGAWHALALRCGGVADCENALQRLRAERAVFDAVERDERKRIVTP
jgi:hypothetical protein